MNYNDFLKQKQVVDVPTGFETPYEINPMLYGFQNDLLLWSLRRGRSALFLDCGTGKSPLQIEYLHHVTQHTKKPTLIFAPLAVSKQTVREGEKFHRQVNLCQSQDDVVNGINITNYQKIHKFDLSQFSGVVLDESSILRDFTGKFRNEIIEKTANIPYKLCCTATPAPNDYMELGNHAEFLNVMSRTEMLSMFFVHDSSNTSKWRLKGHASTEFWRWISSWAVMMRNPSDLGYDGSAFNLPSLNYYEHIIKTNGGDGLLFSLPALTLNDQRKAMRETIGERASFIADTINHSDDSWIIWCNLNDESKILTYIINDAIEVKGSDTDEHKEQSLLDFSLGKISRLVTKPSIAGHGMNWQTCHNMAFVGLSHSWEQFYQATRRCWRFGQENPVNVHIVISDKESSIIQNVKRKEANFKQMYSAMIDNTSDFTRKEIRSVKSTDLSYQTNSRKGQSWELVLGDCIEETKQLNDGSVGFSVFSPPFSSLYVFSNSIRDMGNVTDDEQFLEHYAFLSNELYRVLKQGRLVAIHCTDIPAMQSRDGYIGLKDFPALVRQSMEDAGFIYHSKIIIWKDPLVEVTRTKARGLLYRQLKKDSAKCRVGTPDYIVLMRKPGENQEPITHDSETFPVGEWERTASPVWMDIRQGNTLNKEKGSKDERHITALQLDVIERLLKLYTNKGDLVFSPFAGIGSEGYKAILMDRRFFGIELKEDYFNQAIKHLQTAETEHTQDFLFST